MRATDLRIGNYFKAEHYSFDFFKVQEIRSNFVIFNSGSLFYENIQPIELTEEILLKCGFEKFNDNCFMINYNMQGQLFIFSNKTQVGVVNNINVPFYYMFNGLIHTLQYLHQLQNLYFALTNQELTINL